MSNPLSAIDALVIDGLRRCSAVIAAMGGEAHVYTYDSSSAAWDHRQRPAGRDTWAWVMPAESECDYLATSGSARLVRRYRVGVASAARSLTLLREVEWAVMRSMFTLALRRGPTGGPIIEPAPCRLVDVVVGTSDPERDTSELPDGWSDVCVVTISVDVAHLDLAVVT